MDFRSYDPERDAEDCLRIYGEIGWASSTDDEKRAARLHQACGRTLVAEVGGAVEGFASNQDGGLRYLDADLPACIVAGVGTGRVARRLGIAGRVTAEAIALDVLEKQHAVAFLGMFDQGFYDRLGFGTGVPDVILAFDPKDLRAPAPGRPPVRLGVDDALRMHANRNDTRRVHGSIVLDDAENTRADVLMTGKHGGFGLGFESEPGGALTHHVWLTADEVGQGPYQIRWMAHRTGAELLELFGLLRGLADQVHTIRMVQSHDVPVWDLLERPWRRRALTMGSKHEAITHSLPWWQLRICDLDACMQAVTLPVSEPLRFNLTLRDPIRDHLSEQTAARWGGVAGRYRIRLGATSAVEATEHDPALPTLETSVNAFSRLWLGVLPAAGLAVTSPAFEAPAELIEDLDRVWRLPRPWLGRDI